MAWRLAGTYVGTCNCSGVCPCPTDGVPTAKDSLCIGNTAMQVREGNLDDIDLSGVGFAIVNTWDSNPSAGNWRLGVVIGEGASDEQVDALGRILSGQEGGPFEAFAGFVGENLGVERGPVSVSDGKAQVGDNMLTFEPARGPDGNPTTVKNAALGFAPEFKIGRGTGRGSAFGLTYDADYGESADFEFSSEMEAPIRG